MPLGDDEESLNPVDGAILEQGVDHEGDKQEVGEGGGEVDHLATGLDACKVRL